MDLEGVWQINVLFIRNLAVIGKNRYLCSGYLE